MAAVSKDAAAGRSDGILQPWRLMQRGARGFQVIKSPSAQPQSALRQCSFIGAACRDLPSGGGMKRKLGSPALAFMSNFSRRVRLGSYSQPVLTLSSCLMSAESFGGRVSLSRESGRPRRSRHRLPLPSEATWRYAASPEASADSPGRPKWLLAGTVPQGNPATSASFQQKDCNVHARQHRNSSKAMIWQRSSRRSWTTRCAQWCCSPA